MALVNGENETRLVELIRVSENLIPVLSLVSVDEKGEIIGHILFSVISLLAKKGVIPTISNGCESPISK